MSSLTLGLLFGALFMALGAAIPFTWAALSGQFDDSEAPKYRMLREEDIE